MKRIFCVALCLQLIVPPAFGWGARGHRMIALLAVEGLTSGTPGWLKDEAVRRQIAFQSSECDRWRGWKSDILQHEHKQDHYLDIEQLDQFGLTIETIPHLRTEYLRAMIIAKHVHPERIAPYDAARDPDRTKEWPGQLLHGIAENYYKLQWSFCQVRILESLNDPKRTDQLAIAKASAIYHLGLLSHFIADAAQPLHTTEHFNGWTGENLKGYTTSNKFHGYIDTGVIERHDITLDSLRPLVKFERSVKPADPWDDVVAYVLRSHSHMEELYVLEKSGELDREPGKKLIEERLTDAAAMLAAMIDAAWKSSTPTEKQIAEFAYWDETLPAKIEAKNAATQPATR